MIDNYRRKDTPEVEFDPLYQYHSSNGFRVDKTQYRDSLDEAGLIKFCEEFIPEGENDLDFGYNNYQSYRASRGDSVDFRMNEDRGRSKSLGTDFYTPLNHGSSSSFNAQEMDYLNLSFNMDDILPHHIKQEPTSYTHVKKEVFSPKKVYHEESFPVSSRSSTYSPTASPKDIIRTNEQRTYMNVNTEPSCPVESETYPREDVNWSNALQDMQNVLFFENKFLKKYWRNDRKNIQCFPFCPEFGDYYHSRINNLNHTRSGGTCTSSVKAKLQNNFDDKCRLIALGRITLYNPQEEQQFNYNFELNKSGRRMVSAAEMVQLKKESVKGFICEKSTNNPIAKNECDITFSVSVWKLNMQLSKARRPTNLPSKIPYYIFEAMVLRQEGNGYTLIARNISQKFTISSTRTLLREIIAKKGKESDTNSETTNSDMNSHFVPEAEKRKLEDVEENDFEKKRIRFNGLMGSNSFMEPGRKSYIEPDQKSYMEPVQKEIEFSSPVEAYHPPIDLEKNEPLTATLVPVIPLEKYQLGQNSEYITVLHQNEALSLKEAWIWSLFMGLFGAHYYYLNRARTGLLYTFTLGLLGIGYLYDLFTMPYLVSRYKVENVANIFDLPLCHKYYLREAYIYMIPLGIIGAHHYYLGNISRGLLHTFTLGGFGVFFIRDLLNVQRLVDEANEEQRERYIGEFGEDKWRQIESFNRKYHPERENVCM